MEDTSRSRSSIRRLPVSIAVALAILMALVIPASAAVTAGTGPVTTASASFPVGSPPPAPFDAVQLVLDFAPGAGVPMHHHGGNGYITMLEGELTLQADGRTTTYRAGDSFVEYPSGHYKGWNATNAPARLVVTYLMPKGAAVTTPEEAAPAVGPKTVSQATYEITNPPAQFELIQAMHRYEPGDSTGPQTTASDLLTTVVEGSITAKAGDTEKTYTAGQAVTAPAGATISTANSGTASAVVATTELRPASLAIASATGRPSTAGYDWLLLVAGSGLLVSGMVVRQRIGDRYSLMN